MPRGRPPFVFCRDSGVVARTGPRASRTPFDAVSLSTVTAHRTRCRASRCRMAMTICFRTAFLSTDSPTYCSSATDFRTSVEATRMRAQATCMGAGRRGPGAGRRDVRGAEGWADGGQWQWATTMVTRARWAGECGNLMGDWRGLGAMVAHGSASAAAIDTASGLGLFGARRLFHHDYDPPWALLLRLESGRAPDTLGGRRDDRGSLARASRPIPWCLPGQLHRDAEPLSRDPSDRTWPSRRPPTHREDGHGLQVHHHG